MPEFLVKNDRSKITLKSSIRGPLTDISDKSINGTENDWCFGNFGQVPSDREFVVIFWSAIFEPKLGLKFN